MATAPIDAIDEIFIGDSPADLKTSRFPSCFEILRDMSKPNKHDPSTYINALCGITPKT